jgi:lipoprotein NlpI
MYLAGVTPQAVLDVAADSDAETRRVKQSEAYFYVGEYLLMQGKRSEAIDMFRRAVATGLTGSIEYDAAKAELARLGESNAR